MADDEPLTGYVVLMNGDQEVSEHEPVQVTVEIEEPAHRHHPGRIMMHLNRDVSFTIAGKVTGAVLVVEGKPFYEWPLNHVLDGGLFTISTPR